MDQLLKMGLMALTGGAVAQAGRTAKRTATYIAGLAFAGVLATAAAGCGLAALWVWLVPEVGVIGAWLIVGAVFLLASAIVLLVTLQTHARHERIETPPAPALPSADELKQMVKGLEWPLVAAALAAGIFATRGRR
ncbi:MAG: hypothetical protein AB7F08_01760 [Dongiaceae bacterium]